MVKINFDTNAVEAVYRAPYNTDEAARSLRIAAEYIRAGKPLPRLLDVYIARAFEKSIAKKEDASNTAAENQGKEILKRFNFQKPRHRPQKADWFDVASKMEYRVGVKECSKNEAAKQVAPEFDISISTAKRCHDLYLERIRETEEER